MQIDYASFEVSANRGRHLLRLAGQMLGIWMGEATEAVVVPNRAGHAGHGAEQSLLLEKTAVYAAA